MNTEPNPSAKELAQLVLRICGFTLIALALAFVIYALATGPNLIEIIDNPKY